MASCCSCFDGIFGTSTPSVISRTPDSALVIDNRGKVADCYDVHAEEKLGEGAYGTVCSVRHRKTNVVRVLKTISKAPFVSKPHHLDRFVAEVAILKKIDHPHIVKLYETFEDGSNVHLVLEACDGGELFYRIADVGHFTELQAATVMKQVLGPVRYLHAKHICHRDLKPENFLFQTKDSIETNTLKLIDFGMATVYTPGQSLTMKGGSPMYVAPEVLEGDYNELCDVWSCGVMMYCLLCGYPPFFSEKANVLFRLIKAGTYVFREQEWQHVSHDAKQLVGHLLEKDLEKRYTAEAALNHLWIQQLAPRANNGGQLSSALLQNMKNYTSMERFKKMTINIIATHIEPGKISSLRQEFLSMDSNEDGVLSFSDLGDRLRRAGLQDAELNRLLESADFDRDGLIEYSEFLAAVLDKDHYLQHSALWSAFYVLDRNHDGVISTEDLRIVLKDETLGTYMQTKSVEEIMNELDDDENGVISFDEFAAAMQK